MNRIRICAAVAAAAALGGCASEPGRREGAARPEGERFAHPSGQPRSEAEPPPRGRLAAIEADVKAMREDIAVLRAALEVPVDGSPDVTPDPVVAARLRNRQAITSAQALKTLREEVEKLSKRVDALDKGLGSLKPPQKKK